MRRITPILLRPGGGGGAAFEEEVMEIELALVETSRHP
jgi:hypothetical protein